MRQYGFVADPDKTTHHNACIRLGDMPFWYYTARPTNLAFHDLTQPTTETPKNLASLLGLGLKFIPVPRTTPPWPKLKDGCVDRLDRDMRLRYHFAGQPSNHDPNNPMYVRSQWTPKPWLFPKKLRSRLQSFNYYLQANFKHRRKKTENLLPHQHEALRSLQQSDKLLVVQCDKNLGPALIERAEYIRLVMRDHLSDPDTYERLDEEEASNFARETINLINRWLRTNKDAIHAMEKKFVRESIKNNTDPLPKFYATMKVHKMPLKTRPIVSVSGTLMENLGVWVDRKLQPLLPMFRSYFKSSEELKKELMALKLPKGAQLFTSDAVSMYTNIPTETALRKISRFLRNHQRVYNEPTMPYNAIIEGLGLIMRRCAFSFGDTWWKQLSGTAMGTPPAPVYATIYFGLREQKFLGRYDRNLFFYRRFIDDVVGIWRPAKPSNQEGEDESKNDDDSSASDDEMWERFLDDMDSAEGLTWETTARSNSVDFMDLTLTIEGDAIVTSLYEKPSNKHLYIPSHSSHPPGVINGVVHGMIHRIWTLCSDEKDRQRRARAFVNHLRARGYDRDVILPLAQAAITKQRALADGSTTRTQTDPEESKKRIFLHLPYHPDNPPSRQVQREWKRRVSQPKFGPKLKDFRTHHDAKMMTERLVIAYHRSHNLGNLLSYRDISKRSGPTVSSFIDNG